MSTLDHLTRGRIGWNIVTGYLDSAARAMGHAHQTAHDSRYDLADEYMDAVYKLWEGSWADDAVHADRAAGLYADPARVRAVQHSGPHLRMDAVHLCEPSPQRTPVLYQAGSSGRGKRFAASHAECVFLNGQAVPAVRAIVDDIRAAAAGAGRAPGDLLAFVGATLIVAETDALAQAKLADYRRYASGEGALVHASASMGVDLDAYAMDEPLQAVPTQAIQSNLEAVVRSAPVMTKRKLLDRMVLGSRQAPIVGSPATVADALQHWAGQGTWTASSCPAPSRRSASPTWSISWCRNCSAAAPTRRRTPPAPCAASCSARTACPAPTPPQPIAGPAQAPCRTAPPRPEHDPSRRCAERTGVQGPGRHGRGAAGPIPAASGASPGCRSAGTTPPARTGWRWPAKAQPGHASHRLNSPHLPLSSLF